MSSAAVIARQAPARSAKKLIEQIQGHIEDAGLEAGQLIGTQNELCERYQVSQTVFFQATRILMDRGMAELRQGSGGGLFVSDRSLAQCGQRVAKYFECIGIRFSDCEEVNRMLQELCMRLATGRLPLAAVDRIRAMEEALETADYYQRYYLLSRISQEFAEGSGNIVLAVLYRCITDVLLDFGVDEENDSFAAPQAMVVDLTVAMAEAVIAGRHEEAASFYARVRDALIDKNRIEEPCRIEGVRKHLMRDDIVRRALPDRLAALILRDIIDNGWTDGHHLGREDELLAQYNVSRATFRQAMALLQEYSIVETRRGPAGGILVRTPDFSLIQETALDMMVRRGASERDAWVVWEAMMMLALDRAWRLSPSSVIAACATAAARSTDDPLGAAAALTRSLVDLADLRMLEIFVRLVAEFSLRLSSGPRTADPAQTARLTGEMEHSLACDDLGRARAAFRDYLSITGITLRRD